MMKRRTAAVFLASVLLLASAGCSKTTVVDSTPSDSSTVSDTAVSSGAPQENTKDTADKSDSSVSDSKSAKESSTSDPSDSTTDTTGSSVDSQALSIEPPGGENDQEGEHTPAQTRSEGNADADAVSGKGGNTKNAKLYITVETVEITADALAAQDYQVPLTVYLDKNPGINYSEWGLKLDERCTYTASDKGMDFSTVSFINEERHFLWTAWTSGADLRDYDGGLLKLTVTVPKDAAPGTVYKIEYADRSLADGSHIWSGGTEDWVAQNTVGWTNGGIIIQ